VRDVLRGEGCRASATRGLRGGVNCSSFIKVAGFHLHVREKRDILDVGWWKKRDSRPLMLNRMARKASKGKKICRGVRWDSIGTCVQKGNWRLFRGEWARAKVVVRLGAKRSLLKA